MLFLHLWALVCISTPSFIASKMYLFQSEQLGFRNWREEDLRPFAEMNQDKDVMEFFPAVLTTEASNALLERLKKHHLEHGFTFFAVEKLENHEFIGFIGLARTPYKTDFTPCVEIGWRLKKSAWNLGFATEGAKRCLSYGFTDLDLNEIYSFTPSINSRSEKVMQKIGMQKEGVFIHPKVPVGHILAPHVLYRIDK